MVCDALFDMICVWQGIRDALIDRGWKEHKEEDSLLFDLKWTVKTTDIPFKALNRDQIVNHFQRNGNLTTKVGLTRNLRSLKWFEDVVSFLQSGCMVARRRQKRGMCVSWKSRKQPTKDANAQYTRSARGYVHVLKRTFQDLSSPSP